MSRRKAKRRGAQANPPPRAAAANQRAYEGADRRDGWRPRRAGASANNDHTGDARELRVRARALVQNVPYVTRAIEVLVSSTVGSGLTPNCMTGTQAQRDAVEALWERWGEQCDADGVFDIYGLQAAAWRAMEVDGEVLIRRRWRRAEDGMEVPMQVQLLEADFLDSSRTGPLRGGGRIVNGIEYDAIGRVVAYWLYEVHPGDAWSSGRVDAKRVPASEIIHLYRPARPGQGRGITRLANVIARVRDLSLYEDAELQRKNLETRLAALASFDPEKMANPPEPVDGGQLEDGNLGQLPSGAIVRVPDGANITMAEPKAAPGTVDYCKWLLHLIASGVGVPYESMTGDMVEVNFSSARIRQLDFRREREQDQWLIAIPRMCRPLMRWFLEAAQTSGRLRSTALEFDWSTPRWDYVNPAQDVDAELTAISAGLLSPSEALRRRGYKPEQVYKEMGEDLKRMQDSGAMDLMRMMLFRKLEAPPPPVNATAAS